MGIIHIIKTIDYNRICIFLIPPEQWMKFESYAYSSASSEAWIGLDYYNYIIRPITLWA